MPPKAKFTKEEIVNAAFEIVKVYGMDALTARSLGYALKSSSRPIFTVFNSMEEVQCEVLCQAKALYNSYIKFGLKEEIAFKGVGKAYIKFAQEQPKLFQLLFMHEQQNEPTTETILKIIDVNSEEITSSIISCYGLSVAEAKSLYLHLWIYSHGIAVLIATKVCKFSEKEISDMLTQVCLSLIKKIKIEGAL